MKIIIPTLPSGYARPYPELVLEGTEERMRLLANVLSGLDRSDPRGICCRVTRKPWELLIKAIETALDDYPFITGYLDAYASHSLDEDENDYDVIRAEIRAKWIDHIERSLWEQLGECQT